MKTKVVNLRKHRYDVYIGRGSEFGNPYTHLPVDKTIAEFQVRTRDESIEKFKEYFYNKLETDDEFLYAVYKLKGKVLGCYCTDCDYYVKGTKMVCHGQVIQEFLQNLDEN
jgi:hypothetical protein